MQIVDANVNIVTTSTSVTPSFKAIAFKITLFTTNFACGLTKRKKSTMGGNIVLEQII